MIKSIRQRKTLAVFLLILICSVVVTGLTVYHFAKKSFDEELRRVRLLSAAELALLEESLGAKTFDLDPLLALDRLYDTNSLSDADKKALTEKLLHAYASSVGDAYALYMSPDDYASYLERQNSRFVGIGVSASSQMAETERGDGLTVLTVYKESPASEGGLRAGDILLSANGVSFSEKTQEEAVALVSGEAGSNVTLTYWREGEIFTVTLTRREVTEETVRHTMLEDGIAYIQITRFSSVTPHQLANAVSDCTSSGARAFIFDVRNNPGGLVSSVSECLGYLLPDGDLLHVNYAKKTEKNYSHYTKNGSLVRRTESGEDTISTSIDMANELDLPIAVLTNGVTASAGEIFAAAMRGYYEKGMIDARLFGEKTFGKGTVQATYRTDGGGAFKMTVALYTPPYGESYDGVGLTPDQTVFLPEKYKSTPLDLIPKSEDTQLCAALEYLRTR